jgi:protein kinase-like protein/WD40 repeat protein
MNRRPAMLSSMGMAWNRRGQLDAWLDVELVLPRVDGLDVQSPTVGEDATACAASRPAPAALAPGMQLGKYRLVRMLGAGGMGVVWEARDVDLDRAVALKVLGPALDGNDVARARLVREARALARVQHRNVITIFDASTIDGRDVIAMELIEGETLASWLARRPRRSAIVAAIVAAGRGLAVAHAAGMVHRDFKPYNVLIDVRGRVVVTDFGLARAIGESAPVDPGVDPRALGRLDSPLTAPGAVLGTPAYMAPEQFDGGPADARADQFALCVTAWEAFAGQRPFVGAITVQLAAAIATGRPVAADRVPRRLRAILQRGLAPDPDARWPSVDALLDALTRAWRRPARIALALVAAALVALVAAGVVKLRHEPWQPQIVDLPAFEENGDGPAISPDGTRIAYISDRERKDTFRVYVAALPAGEARAITPAGDSFQTPRWTRDGAALLLVRWDPPSRQYRIVRQPLDGGPWTDLGTGYQADDCGDAIAIADVAPARSALVLQRGDGTRQVLARTTAELITLPRCDRDGQRIVFTRGPTAQQTPVDDVFVIDRAGRETALTRDHASIGGAFTPDGSVVLSTMHGGKVELFEVPATGGEPRQLTHDDGAHYNPDVSPDGRTIAFNLEATTIVVMAGGAGDTHTLTTRRQTLDAIAATRDGQYIVAERLDEHRSEVIAIATGDGGEHALTPGRRPFPSLDGRRVLFGAADGAPRLLAIPIGGGAVTTVADLPGPLVRGADGPEGPELLISRDGGLEAWRLTRDGRVEPRGVAGLVIPAPSGGWSAVETFDNPNHIANRLWLVPPGGTLDPPPGGPAIVPESERPTWLDDHRIAYAAHGAFHVVDATTGAEVATLPGPDWGQRAVLAADGVHWYDLQLISHITRHLIANFGDRPWR